MKNLYESISPRGNKWRADKVIFHITGIKNHPCLDINN